MYERTHELEHGGTFQKTMKYNNFQRPAVIIYRTNLMMIIHTNIDVAVDADS